MDYIGNKCPVCDKYFHIGDDIVVCPECGTPHHRECYENLSKCANDNLHSQNYDYAKDDKNDGNSDVAICKKCGYQNDKQAFFCNKCGFPLNENAQNSQANGMPFQNQNVNPNNQNGQNVNFGGFGYRSNANNNASSSFIRILLECSNGRRTQISCHFYIYLWKGT